MTAASVLRVLHLEIELFERTMTGPNDGAQPGGPQAVWTYTLDQDPIHTFDDDQKITWMQGRVERMLLVAFRDPKVRVRFNQEPQQPYDLNLGLMTLACCAIEALGRFLHGGSVSNPCKQCGSPREEPGAGKCFRDFICRYVPTYKPLAGPLYGSFRCALAHSFAIRDGGLTHDLGEPFLQGDAKTTPHQIDFDRFIRDVDAGIRNYFDDLRGDSGLRANFLKHWNNDYAFWIRWWKNKEESKG